MGHLTSVPTCHLVWNLPDMTGSCETAFDFQVSSYLDNRRIVSREKHGPRRQVNHDYLNRTHLDQDLQHV